MARILALTNWYPPHHRGGYEILCADVMTRMAARGHHVEVLCGDERLAGIADDDTGLRVRRELSLYWKGELPWAPRLSDQVRIERSNQRALTTALEDVRPDVVAVWHMGALSLGLLTTLCDRGIPIVYAFCDSWPNYAVGQDAWSNRWQRNPVRRIAGRFVSLATSLPAVLPDLGAAGTSSFISEFTRADVRTNSPWSFPRSDVIAAGIDRSEFATTGEEHPPQWNWRLAYMGRFDARKGTETLLRAMTLLPQEAVLTMYGRGGDRPRLELQLLATKLGVADRVLLASLDRHMLGPAYRAADCVVFPSEWPEPFGLVPLEAMECGTPVVATGVGGSGEFLVDGQNCLLFRPGDHVALAEAVLRLSRDPALRMRLVETGHSTAKVYDVERMADLYEQRFSMAAAGGSTKWEAESRRPGAAISDDPLSKHQAAADALLWRHPDEDADEEAVKALYRDLGDYWWESRGDVQIPVLSYPEIAPKVVELIRPIRGLVLDAGCGPSPSVSIGVAASDGNEVVSMDIGLGTVRVARAEAADQGVAILGVVGDVEHLPFRDAAFDALACDDTIEHLPNDRLGVCELARVLRPRGLAVLATPNRHSALVLKNRVRDWWRGWHRPRESYFVSNSHLREYTWSEFEALARVAFDIQVRVPVGWDQGPKRRLLSRFLIGPGREVSQAIAIAAAPRWNPSTRPELPPG